MIITPSPMDYYFYRRSLYTIQFVFEFRGSLDVGALESALVRAGAFFPAVTARIRVVGATELVLETGHEVPVRCARIGEPTSTDNVDSFLDAINNVPGEPLVKFLVSRTPSRSFVGVSFSHMLGDGASFLQFLTGLASLLRGEEPRSAHDDRTALHRFAGTDKVTPDSLFAATGYVLPRPETPLAFEIETLRFSYQQLEDLRRAHATKGVEVSVNDILMAELALRYHRSIPLYEGKFIVRCPVDYRKQMGLPMNYFGNAVRDALAIFGDGELESLPRHEVAVRIRAAIKGVNERSVNASLVCLESLRKQRGLNIFEDVGCPGLLVSNLTKFPFAEIDLGLGPPEKMHHASLNPRLAFIMATREGVEVRFKRPLTQSQTEASTMKIPMTEANHASVRTPLTPKM